MGLQTKINVPDLSVTNKIINGNFDVWQRWTSQLGFNNTKWLSDRFQVVQNTGPFGQRNLTRETDVPNSDSKYSLKFEVAVASGAIANGEFVGIQYRGEGQDLLDIQKKNCVISFWIKSNVVGKKSMVLLNGGSQDVRIYKNYTINSANTWERKFISVSMEDGTTLGTWNYDNSLGFTISWNLDYGSDFYEDNEDTWLYPSGKIGSSDSMTNFHETVGNYIQLSQVMFHEGLEVIPFERAGRNYVEEYSLCRRYYQKDLQNQSNNYIGHYRDFGSPGGAFTYHVSHPMRTLPSIDIGMGLTALAQSGVATTITALSTRNMTDSAIYMNCTLSAEISGSVGVVENATGGYLAFDAEL